MKPTYFTPLFLAICSLSFAKQIDLTISIQEGAGLYAELHKVLQSIIHYEKNLNSVFVDWTDEFFPYKDDPYENGWDIFFEPIPSAHTSSPKGELEKVHIDSTSVHHELHDQCCVAPWVAYNEYLPYRKFVHEKIEKYIRFKPNVSQAIDTFYAEKMAGSLCIGVHARLAKAHTSLVPGKVLPELNDYFNEVDKLLSKNPSSNVKIFVASDSHFGVQKFKERYGDKVIHIDAYRAAKEQDPCILYTSGAFFKENKNIWHDKKHRSFGGLTTILDCVLLSKCTYLIHTTSNLAFFATYYNPEISSIYLPKGLPFRHCVVKGDPTIANPFLNPI